jgi:RNA polymerase sigma factor (sigma-70 family)
VADAPLGLVTDYLHRLAAPLAAMSDRQLLARYARHRDEEAFALLLRRHGPMVLGVCRRALGPLPDADDAFQAAFIALARHATRVTDSVPGWLYRVAVRVSRRAARRADRTYAGSDVADRSDPFAAIEWAEVRRLLDDELNRLPARWRTPLVLCYLEGIARDEAAKQLGWSLRTLHRRLDEARSRLRERLTRRGLAPATLAAAVLSADGLRSEVPPALARQATRLAARGAVVPDSIRSLIPRLAAPGGLAMKFMLSALVVVAGLAVAMSTRQPSEAAPLPRPELPPILVRAPAAKDKAPEDPLRKQVREAQEKGVKYLKERQRDEGSGKWSWENDALAVLQKGGTSALALLALLECGEPVKDDTVDRGLKYLRTVEPQHTYVVSLQTQVLCKANQKEDADRIKRNVKWLVEAAVWDGRDLTGWSYGTGAGGAGRADNSNTRYAVAALYAAHKARFKSSNDKVWPAIRDMYVRTQKADGGWGYTPEAPKATHTMTASGLLGLLQAKDILAKDVGPPEKAIDNGFAWLASQFRLQNPPHTFYNFDVVAALGRASERKDFGTKDKKIEWFRIGAEWLLTNQKANGEWRISAALDDYPVISTSFALRFLASRPD